MMIWNSLIELKCNVSNVIIGVCHKGHSHAFLLIIAATLKPSHRIIHPLCRETAIFFVLSWATLMNHRMLWGSIVFVTDVKMKPIKNDSARWKTTTTIINAKKQSQLHKD